MTSTTRRDYQDVIAGLLLIVLGAAAAYHSYHSFPIGTVSRMGPGMFPMWLGITLVVLGALITLPAFFRAGSIPIPEKRPTFFVLASVLAFALTVEVIGLVPSIFLLTGFAVLADKKLGILGTIVLASCLSLMAWLIFLVGLGIPIQPFVWPF
jgi:hypothetical protein